MALLTQKGYKVQPFKCGPDYIDTKFHEKVCGRPSINLDTFMATPEHVRHLFAHYGKDADVCIIEGMMGLFDGYDRDKGSASEIARVLDLPVVLVVDARSAAYSMAALLQGFLQFRSDIRFAGVIFNKVGSPRHQQMLRQVCSDLNIKCLGCVPKDADLEQGSRYLGLDFSETTDCQRVVSLLGSCLGWSSLFSSRELPVPAQRTACSHQESCLLLVARNAEAFSFVYQEVLDRYQDVAFFDPETEVPELDHVGLLYLPGGYPEKHLDALVGNEACRKTIKAYAERGGRIQAECGGMMYLCDQIVTDDGEYPMCGVLPYTITSRKVDRKLSLGYRRFMLDGKEYRGHEFHYTQFLGEKPQSVTQVYNALGDPVETPVLRYKNVLASYTHLYKLMNDE